MKKKNLRLGISVIALAFVMMVLDACATREPIRPDDQSSVVYFFGFQNDGASVWDGEKPIGDFGESYFMSNFAYKTNPGEHYFMFNTFNWVVMKADLQPNKCYYIKVDTMPNPIPFSKNFVYPIKLGEKDGEEWIKRTTNKTFSDSWRAKFAQGRLFKEAQDHLRDAMNDKKMEVDLR